MSIKSRQTADGFPFFSAFFSFPSFSSLHAHQDSESPSLSAGESRAKGIGRPAPPIGEAGPIPQRPVGRSRPLHSGRPCRETGSARSSAAACESDPAPGGPASAFRTAVGVRPRPPGTPHPPAPASFNRSRESAVSGRADAARTDSYAKYGRSTVFRPADLPSER